MTTSFLKFTTLDCLISAKPKFFVVLSSNKGKYKACRAHALLETALYTKITHKEYHRV